MNYLVGVTNIIIIIFTILYFHYVLLYRTMQVQQAWWERWSVLLISLPITLLTWSVNVREDR